MGEKTNRDHKGFSFTFSFRSYMVLDFTCRSCVSPLYCYHKMSQTGKLIMNRTLSLVHITVFLICLSKLFLYAADFPFLVSDWICCLSLLHLIWGHWLFLQFAYCWNLQLIIYFSSIEFRSWKIVVMWGKSCYFPCFSVL